ncbi:MULTISPECIES: F0F1 ATP synthase subunit delta [Corallincola]|uniref:ATP synthase subunit delta n=3 Tax=Corallincola TaxID=1775176 RepID=A0A368N5Z8_9GAMM|nr:MULTISPECIES: F0F1 ATP synthase subunit delta [Corallincola]RCU45423.1 F0F1 ATP synthase subunit delta [Corallincola holothuriorum]TAA41067.1 F0F1 ATP synthase subunit delta [Corallincola spongiicola]TCI02719.1 F0F1 ATP synthase subunit delta [Corallincola luteus]
MSDLTTIARPYAKAAFDFAIENNTLSDWNEMLAFAAAVSSEPQVSTLLAAAGNAEKAAEVFNTLCDEQLNEHGRNLIKVMAENKRLQALPEVFRLYQILKAEHELEIDVYCTSNTDLDAAQKQAISQAMAVRLSRKVKLICNVDSTLLGGVVIKAGDLVIDNTIRGKLDRMADSLLS